MIKEILIFIIFLFSMGNVSAYNIQNNNYTNMSEMEITVNDFSDLTFYLNNTDYLNSIEIHSLINTKDQKIFYRKVHTFYDSKGNVLKIQFNYIVNHVLFGLEYHITRTFIVSYNNNIIFAENENDDILKSISILGIPTKTPIREKILFTDYNTVIIGLPDIIGIHREFKYLLPEKFIITDFKLADDFTDLSYDHMYITTIDNTNDLFRIKMDIDVAYNSLHIVFKFVFIIIKGITSIFNFFGLLGSDHDFYTLQNDLLAPIQILNLFLVIMINIVKFIFVMGIIWIFTFTEMILFIFAYISDKNRDITKTISKWLNISYIVWNTILITPLKWIFEKLVKLWS